MKEIDIKRFGFISMVNTEIQAMEVENSRYRISGMLPKHSEKAFEEKALLLKKIVFSDNDRLEKLIWDLGSEIKF